MTSAPYSQSLISALETSIRAKQAAMADADMLDVFQAATAKLVQVYKAGGRVYIAGNGGSAADAQHLAAEFVSKLSYDRNPLPAEALTTDSSTLTAIGNDYGFDQVFARQIEGKVGSNDIFLGISTSGASPNIAEALRCCRKKAIPSIAFLGKSGGICKDLADFSIIAPGDETATIQEVHIVLAHSMCGCVEAEMFPRS